MAETGNQVILYQGQLIDAVFHSSSSAATQDAVEVWGNSVPYLQSVDSPEGEGVPNYESQVTLTTQEFKDAFLKAQPTASLEGDPASWVGTIERTQSGSVHAITIGGVTVSGPRPGRSSPCARRPLTCLCPGIPLPFPSPALATAWDEPVRRRRHGRGGEGLCGDSPALLHRRDGGGVPGGVSPPIEPNQAPGRGDSLRPGFFVGKGLRFGSNRV